MREGRGRTQRTRPDGRVFRDRGHGWCERSLEHKKHAHGDAFVVFKGMGRGGRVRRDRIRRTRPHGLVLHDRGDGWREGSLSTKNPPIGGVFFVFKGMGRNRTRKTRPHGRVFRVWGDSWCVRPRTQKHATNGRIFVFEGMGSGRVGVRCFEHEKHGHEAVFFVFVSEAMGWDGAGDVREPANTKNVPQWARFLFASFKLGRVEGGGNEGSYGAAGSWQKLWKCQELETKEEKTAHLVRRLPFRCPCPSVPVRVVVVVSSAAFVRRQCCRSGGG